MYVFEIESLLATTPPENKSTVKDPHAQTRTTSDDKAHLQLLRQRAAHGGHRGR